MGVYASPWNIDPVSPDFLSIEHVIVNAMHVTVVLVVTLVAKNVREKPFSLDKRSNLGRGPRKAAYRLTVYNMALGI